MRIKTFLQAAEISKLVAVDELLQVRVRIHFRSTTRSYSKLIAADDGDEGYIGVVGSCNWLYRAFHRSSYRTNSDTDVSSRKSSQPSARGLARLF
jgi:hypothetical protein